MHGWVVVKLVFVFVFAFVFFFVFLIVIVLKGESSCAGIDGWWYRGWLWLQLPPLPVSSLTAPLLQLNLGIKHQPLWDSSVTAFRGREGEWVRGRLWVEDWPEYEVSFPTWPATGGIPLPTCCCQINVNFISDQSQINVNPISAKFKQLGVSFQMKLILMSLNEWG